MAYDPELAQRIRNLFAGEPDVDEQQMFGGLAFLVGGHMAVAASGSGGLMLRVDAEETDRLLAREHAEPFVMRGKAMRGWIRVDALGVEDDEELAQWAAIGLDLARSLPPKE